MCYDLSLYTLLAPALFSSGPGDDPLIMATVESSQRSSTPTPSHPALPRLVTASKRASLPRHSPLAKNRVSTLSSHSSAPQPRPPSHALPVYEPAVQDTIVRDFAYSTLHPLHYGPASEPSGPGSIASTPVSESQRRLSDPSRASWGAMLGGWSAGPWGGDGSVNDHQPPLYMHKDGPPFNEDDDLQSPVVSSRHKRHKTTIGAFGGGHGRGPGRGGGGTAANNDEQRMYSQYFDRERGYYAGTKEDGSKTYYVNEADAAAGGPGGEYVTYPPEGGRHSLFAGPYDRRSQRDSHFAITLPNRSYVDHQTTTTGERHENSSDEPSDSISSPGGDDDDDHRGDHTDRGDTTTARYSRGYQFPITSPDEEMHGKAIALFDFARENENELPLVEGQVIWVTYRHGQGWLVAEDLHTRESGLVPEEYVRLLRDIRGEWDDVVVPAHRSHQHDDHDPSSPNESRNR